MTRCTFFSALMAVLLIPSLAFAEATPDGATASASEPVSVIDGEPEGSGALDTIQADTEDVEVGWEQFDDPNFDPSQATASEGVAQTEPSDAEILDSIDDDAMAGSHIRLGTQTPAAPLRSGGIILGPLGHDDLGRTGRLHTVATGDTLWDLSAAYLGTPWVWPSVWIDNDEIANPHLILPGNKIWITANEMRVVTDAEAESFLAPPTDGSDSGIDADSLTADMAGEEDGPPVAALDDALDSIAEDGTSDALETTPGLATEAPTQVSMVRRQIRVSSRESMGFLSAEKFNGASSIVDSPVERTFLAAGDDVILGMGEGEAEVGDRFSIFSALDEVRDPETKRLLGHHVEALGWVEVKELTGDTSIAEIRTSYSEIPRGARIVRRELAPASVEIRTTPEIKEGKVVFLPADRTIMGGGGYVYLNRGEFHGVELGSELEIFDPGEILPEAARQIDVRTPDEVVARLVVVTVESESSVGFVIWSTRELAVGDSVRSFVARLAQR